MIFDDYFCFGNEFIVDKCVVFGWVVEKDNWGGLFIWNFLLVV